MNTEHRYKQFAPVFVALTVFYLVVLFLPHEMVIVGDQPRLWVRITNALMTPFLLASVALGVVGFMFCLRAKKEKRPVKGLMFATIYYASGALLFFGVVVWWLVWWGTVISS